MQKNKKFLDFFLMFENQKEKIFQKENQKIFDGITKIIILLINYDYFSVIILRKNYHNLMVDKGFKVNIYFRTNSFT